MTWAINLHKVTAPKASMQDVSDHEPCTWKWVRQQFELTQDYKHLGASQFIASHPKMVRDAIERHRRALDANPVLYLEKNEDRLMDAVRVSIAEYLGAKDPNEVALTDSTTMGLGLLYTGMPLGPGDEVLTTDHEHYSHLEALRGVCQRQSVSLKRVPLYQDCAANADARALVRDIITAVGSKTRVVAVTWVHSDTGLKLPVGALGQALATINQTRNPDEQIMLCVDGTHGIGIETDTIADLGCDFFIGDCHKWLYGPRGTGFIWGRLRAWKRVRRVLPSFTGVMDDYSAGEPPNRSMDGRQFTPSGFHSLEHRWAATEVFRFHALIGRARIRERVRELNQQCKAGLASMEHVHVHTPSSVELSAGVTAFELTNMSTSEARKRLLEKRIIATVAPYPSALLRLTPGIINTPDEVEVALAEIRALAG
jgi:selenocysteine lyase/cysteine desulfurase